MNALDYIIIVSVAVAVILAVIWSVHRRKIGKGCCNGCRSCRRCNKK